MSQLLTVETRFAAMTELPKAPVTIKLVNALSRDEVRASVRARRGAARACYEALLHRHPTAAGALQFAFTITNTGKLTDVHVSFDGTLEEPEHRACVERAVATLHYPAWSKDLKDKTTVRYPIAVLECEDLTMRLRIVT